VTSFSYDTLLRRDRIRGSLNQPAGAEKVTGFDRLGRIQTQTDEAGNVTTTAYDLFNQPLNVTLPDHTVANPRIQTFTYNAYGQPLTQSGAGDYPLTHTYDLAGNLVTLVTQYGAGNTNQTTTWTYDSRNRVNRKTYADNTSYDYTYDENGNLKTRTDAKNQITSYSYNLFNQVATVDYPADSDVTFTYDASGRRLSMTDGSRSGAPSTEWTYDAAGRIATYKQHPVDRIISYGYNAEGGRASMRVEQISAPGTPWTTAYTYDAAGRLDTVTDSRVGEVAFDYTWDAKANLVKEILMPSGAKQQKAYDSLARLSEIKALNGSGTTVNRYAYTYDAASLRKEVTLADNGKITYGYDAKRQVTSAVKDNEADYNYSYTFDNIGNWLTGKTGQTGGAPLSKTFTPNSLNQYSEVSAVSLTYDANGNLTHDGTRTYAYDQENRLTAVAEASFTYDGMSRRVISGATKFLYDGAVPIAELDAANNYTRTVTRGLDLANTFQKTGGVGGVLATVSASVTGYYFYDGNGNVINVADNSHSVIAHYAYDPFGNKVAENGSYAAQPYQWSTKEFDSTSGLVYYLYRFYNPQIGRWTNRDPIEERGGMNLYALVRNRGVNRWDVLGLAEDDKKIKCSKYYIVGHGSDIQKMLEDFNSRRDECSSASGNGCNTVGANGDKGIPGFTDTPTTLVGVTFDSNNPNCGNGGCNPNDQPGSKKKLPDAENEATGFINLTNKNWEATKRAAKEAAEDCKCDCKQITAKFICREPFNSSNMQRINIEGHGNAPKCGEILNYPCKKNSKP
jgi:RHS repeat-associated protein